MIEKNSKKINIDWPVAEIVRADYHTADVFCKYGIDFCCGGRWPLRTVCETRNLDANIVIRDLADSMRIICIPTSVRFEEWNINFLTDYIINVHHSYLKKALPGTKAQMTRFVEEHRNKFSYLPDLSNILTELSNEILPHLQQEETIIFPYIRQISHAYYSKESYAALLVRTLRKPVENVMSHEDESLNKFLRQLRELTDDYTIPENACISHKVIFLKLLELDNDLVQHLYLENEILFPRAIAMEKELLERGDC
jgi:regulator of cell morphogenesis and NO signaling